jgi:hypothetical protein
MPDPSPFLLDPANADFVATKSGRPAALVVRVDVARMVFIGALIVGAVCVPLAIHYGQDTWALGARGVEVQGTIASRYVSEISNNGRGHSTSRGVVRYRFEVPGAQGDGGVFDASDTVSASDYERLGEGTPVTVRYLPDDPHVSRIVGVSRDPAWIFVFFSLLAFASAVAAAVLGVRDSRRKARLERDGIPLEGKLVSATLGGEDEKELARVDYSFTSPTGRSLVGFAYVQGSARRGTPPPVGTPVAVLYLDDALHRLL